jgi:2-keto-4-pentenoate hydratase
MSISLTAAALVRARHEACPLASFPGEIPGTLNDAYALQEAGIRLWGDEPVGWKVGRIAPELQAPLGCDRLAGPIFRGTITRARETLVVEVPVFVGGFSAVEAEFVYELREDVPERLDWTLAEVEALHGRMLLGAELAGSPLRNINDLGPTVIASDFGNNAGLIVGAPIVNWGQLPLQSYECSVQIADVLVGRGSARDIPGGPLESVRFLLEHLASRGRTLRAGQFVSTGAVTGVHAIEAAQAAHVSFGAHGGIRLRTVAATARPRCA